MGERELWHGRGEIIMLPRAVAALPSLGAAAMAGSTTPWTAGAALPPLPLNPPLRRKMKRARPAYSRPIQCSADPFAFSQA